MDDYESLSHKMGVYHVLFIPKYRRNSLLRWQPP